MRHSALALALVFAAPAAAQEPDTTDWHLYSPLEVGNEWQYLFDAFAGADYYTSLRIAGDSLVEGTPYFVVEPCTRLTSETEAECGPWQLIRYEEDTAAVVERIEIGGEPRLKVWPRGLRGGQ
jgi:hypothetical protein